MAKPFWYCPLTGKQTQTKQSDDAVYFSSAFEFRIYLLMISALSKRWRISRQSSILYKPETSNYKALSWKVDFRIEQSLDYSNFYLIEAKGDWIYEDRAALAELQHKIQFLEFVSPLHWEKLIIVGDSKPHVLENIRQFNAKEFQAWLKRL